jgi:hypothetical protein
MNKKEILEVVEGFVSYMKLYHTHFCVIKKDEDFKIIDSKKVLERIKDFQSELFAGEIKIKGIIVKNKLVTIDNKPINELISSCEKRIVELENEYTKYDISNPMIIIIKARIEEINLQIENLKGLRETEQFK